MGREREETHRLRRVLVAGPLTSSLPPALPPTHSYSQFIAGPEPTLPETRIAGSCLPQVPSMVSPGYTLGIWVEVLLLEFPTSRSLTEQEERRLCSKRGLDPGSAMTTLGHWAGRLASEPRSLLSPGAVGPFLCNCRYSPGTESLCLPSSGGTMTG